MEDRKRGGRSKQFERGSDKKKENGKEYNTELESLDWKNLNLLEVELTKTNS